MRETDDRVRRMSVRRSTVTRAAKTGKCEAR